MSSVKIHCQLLQNYIAKFVFIKSIFGKILLPFDL